MEMGPDPWSAGEHVLLFLPNNGAHVALTLILQMIKNNNNNHINGSEAVAPHYFYQTNHNICFCEISNWRFYS